MSILEVVGENLVVHEGSVAQVQVSTGNQYFLLFTFFIPGQNGALGIHRAFGHDDVLP